MKGFFAFALPVAATGSCALVVASCASSGSPNRGESTANARSALTFLTREIDGTVAFSNTNPTVTGILGSAGNCGGNVGAQSTGPTSPSPALAAGTSLFGVSPDHLSADYQLTVDAPECPDDLTYAVNASVALCNAGGGGYYIPGPPPPPSNVCQNAAGSDAGPVLGPLSYPITDCAGIVDVTFSAPVTGASLQAYHPLVTPLLGGGPQSQGNYTGPLTEVQLPVRGDGSLVRVDAFYTTGTDDFTDKIRRLCRFTDVAVGCDQVVPLTCNVQAGGSGTDLGTIIGNVDMVTEFENLIVGDKRTLMIAQTGPLQNDRLYWVQSNPDPVTESPPASFAGESSGPFVLANLLNSDASIPVTSSSTPWPVWGDMSLRNGVQAEYFSSPQLADQQGQPNAAIPVAAGATVNLGDTFVMHPGYIDGDILFVGPKSPSPSLSCVKDILRASDGQPANAVPPDWSLGGESFVGAQGVNQLASGATRTALNGAARVNFDAAFDPLGARFIGPTVEPNAYELVLGILSPDTSALWLESGTQLRFTDPQRLQKAPFTDATLYQDSVIGISENPAPQFTITAGGHVVHPLHYCFGRLTINYQNIGSSGPGTFLDPQFSLSGTFSGPDVDGQATGYNVGGTAYGTPSSPLAQVPATNGTVVACLPQGTYDLSPQVTATNSGGGTSATTLPQAAGVGVACGGDTVITPPLVVTATVPACVASSSVPVSAIVTSSDPAQPQIPIDTVTVSVSQTEADAGADAGTTVTAFGSMCSGGDAGAAAACGGGSDVACGCTTSPTLTQTVQVAACRSTVTVTATSTESGGPTKTSSDTRTVFFDPSAPTLGCQNVSVPLSPGQGSVAVSYPLAVNDACPQDVVVTCDTPSGSSFGPGTKTVHCTADNGCSQTQCTFQVNVTASCPALACPADATLTFAADVCQASATYDAVLSDPCAGTPPTSVAHTFAFGAPGSQAFTYQAGGQSCTQTVTAVDKTPPSITTQPIAPVQVCGTGSTTVELPIPQACDACSPAAPVGACHDPVAVTGTIVSRNGSPIAIPVPASGSVALSAGTYVVSWSATDASGNSSTVTQTFGVNGPPTPATWNANHTYHAGDRVSIGGFVFEARQTNRGVRPALPGAAAPDATLAIWDIPTPCGVTPWQDETHYLPGSMVTYQGATYVCIGENYAVFNWTPDAVPALWRRATRSDTPICPCP